MKHINQIVFLFSLFVTCLSHATLPDLHQAAYKGNLEHVKQLLNSGADVNTVDTLGQTPLHGAAGKGHEAIVKLLIERGAKVNVATCDGFMPLHIATRWDQEGVTRVLLDADADVNAAAEDGWTSLHVAAYNGHKAIAQLLLERGANLNAVRESVGRTPLHEAELFSHTKVATLLRRWPKYQNFLKERKEQMYAFLMASHPRIGVHSPANALPPELFKYIWKFVKPTIEEAEENLEKSWLSRCSNVWFQNIWPQGRKVVSLIAFLSILGFEVGYSLDHFS